MNKIRRKELAKIVAKLAQLDELCEEIMNDLRQVANDEENAMESMPESLQASEKGEQMREYIDTMDTVLEELEEFDVESLKDQLQDIIG